MPFPRIKPNPDFRRLQTVFRRGVPDRVPLLEFWLDYAVVGEVPRSTDPVERWRETAAIWRGLGCDALPVSASFELPRAHAVTRDTALTRSLPSWVLQPAPGEPDGEGTRAWREGSRGLLATWEDFEDYPWPTAPQVDYRDLEYAAAALPEGMGLLGIYSEGLLEAAQDLMGTAPLAYALADQPDLIQAILDRLGQLMLDVCRTNASHEAIGAVVIGDDLGFKTQTILSPDTLRTYIFPWYRRVAQTVHTFGKPLLLHTCGQVEAVVADLVEAGIDGKHSYEDVITPVEEAKRRWSDRLAILGGLDMDVLSRGTPDQVRQRTRDILAACMPGGGYALGSGNSIANYVPRENYFAMIEAGWEMGVYG